MKNFCGLRVQDFFYRLDALPAVKQQCRSTEGLLICPCSICFIFQFMLHFLLFTTFIVGVSFIQLRSATENIRAALRMGQLFY